MKVTKTRQTRASLKEAASMWAELAKLEGIPATAVGVHAAALCQEPEPPRRKPRDFTHPANCPKADEMLQALADSPIERGFGVLKTWGPRDEALSIETKLYNTWVQLQCRTNNQRSPGELSTDQFCERYWQDDDMATDSEGAQ